MTQAPAESGCSTCDRHIDCCEVCDRPDCAAAVCYACLRSALGLAMARLHAYGG